MKVVAAPRGLATVLRDTAERHAGVEALVDGDRRISYGEFAELVTVAAGRLAEAGVEAGDRVAIDLPNGWRYAVAYYGIQHLGAVAVLVNTRLAPPEVDFVLRDSGARLVVTTADEVDRVRPQTPALLVNDLTEHGPCPDLAPVEAAPEAIANLLYTSGTTGRPKGAMQTHGNCWANSATVATMAGLGTDDRTLLVAPLFHATGLNSQLNAFVAVGGTCVFTPRFDAAETLALLSRERITLFAGVATMLWLFLNRPEFAHTDLSALRVAVVGGSPAPESLLAAVAEALPHTELGNVWGQTEATSVCTWNRGEELLERPWSVGRPVPGVEIRVDRNGELLVRGPNVTAGYWNLPEATATTFRDGWLHTGDVGRVDGHGYVEILDRLKDMIIRGGENIYSLEVENALQRCDWVADAAAVGVPDEVFGERVRAVVVAIEPGHDADELRRFAAKHLADYKVPAEVLFLDALPRNANGKVQKQQLVELDG